MIRPARHAARVALLVLTAQAPSRALAAWPHDTHTHVPVCTALGDQTLSSACSDGSGGIILAWQDARSGSTNLNIFAQRVSAAGAPLWGANGVQVTTALNNQMSPVVTSDGQGGCLIAWVDQRAGAANGDIYSIRLTPNGAVAPGWVTGGTAVSTTVNDEYQVGIASDGFAGAWITWTRKFGPPDEDVELNHMTAGGGFGPGFGLNGAAMTTITSVQNEPALAADGAGGAFVVWSDGRNGDTEIWEQHFSAAGAPLNGSGGVQVFDTAYDDQNPAVVADGFGGAWVATVPEATLSIVGPLGPIYVTRVPSSGPGQFTTAVGAANYQGGPQLLADGSGGVFIAFLDYDNLASQTTYVQHVSPGAVQLWGSLGLALSPSGGGLPVAPRLRLVPDGSAGIIVAWSEARNGTTDVFAQRVSPAGSVVWQYQGVPITDLLGQQWDVSLTADGAGGAIAAWTDSRTGPETDLYAQRIERFGKLGNPEPVIADVADVLGDQGGRVRVSWAASYLDQVPNDPIDSYTVWRQVPAAFAIAALQRGARLLGAGDAPRGSEGRLLRTTTTAAGTYYWEYVASQIARGFPGYSYSADTPGDSAAGSNPYTTFMVEAEQSNLGLFWSSAPDSGYSVDNLAPATPSPFTASYSSGTTRLHWGANLEGDFLEYHLHRGSTVDFVPSALTLIATAPDTGFTDPSGTFHGYYKLSALDVHGNESPFALVGPSSTVDVQSRVPSALGLALTSSNPARGGAGVRLELPEATVLELGLYDLQGRRVRRLLTGVLPAGEHSLRWDGRDDGGQPTPAGVYVLRLSARGRSFTRRLAFVR